MTIDEWTKMYENSPEFIIVEIDHGAEFKIAIKSVRYTDDCMKYNMLAEVYYLGDKSPFGPAVRNSFKTYQEAKEAWNNLNKERSNVSDPNE